MIAIVGVAAIMLLMPSKSNVEISTSNDVAELEDAPRILDMDTEPTEDISEELIAKEKAMM